MDAEVPQGRGIANNIAIPGVKNIIAVSSGKGGVGKSTVAVNLAVALAKDGAKVGMMDADVYGPNVPMMLGTGYDQPEVRNGKLVPIEAHGIKMISMAVLVPPDKPMILRGPMLHGVVRQFLDRCELGRARLPDRRYAAGNGRCPAFARTACPVQGAVLVTTPQEVSLSDVRRAVKMFEKVNFPVLGVIENMSYFIAPDTGNRYEIFGSGGGQKLADEYDLNFLGEVPIGMEVREGGDKGVPVVVSAPRLAPVASISQGRRRSRPADLDRSDEAGTGDHVEGEIGCSPGETLFFHRISVNIDINVRIRFGESKFLTGDH